MPGRLLPRPWRTPPLAQLRCRSWAVLALFANKDNRLRILRQELTKGAGCGYHTPLVSQQADKFRGCAVSDTVERASGRSSASRVVRARLRTSQRRCQFEG